MLKKTLFLCPVGNLKNVRRKNLLKMGYAFKSIRHKIIVLMPCICTKVGCEKYGKLNNGKLRCQMGKKYTLKYRKGRGSNNPSWTRVFIKIGKLEEIWCCLQMSKSNREWAYSEPMLMYGCHFLLIVWIIKSLIIWTNLAIFFAIDL